MNADPTNHDAPQAVAPPKGQRDWLVGMVALLQVLVRRGTRMLEMLGQEDLEEEKKAGFRRLFRTPNLTLVVARIRRALAMAAALDDRLFRMVCAIDRRESPEPKQERPASMPAAVPREARGPRAPAALPAWDDEALLRRMPTVRQIAAMVRSKSPEDVFLDICRDLGVSPDSDGWDEVLATLTVPPDVVAARVRRERRRFGLVPTEDGGPADVSVGAMARGTGPPGVVAV